jgi:hypothetical protein
MNEADKNLQDHLIDEHHGKSGAYIIVDGVRVLDTEAVTTKVDSDITPRAPYDDATTASAQAAVLAPAPPIEVPAEPMPVLVASDEPAPPEPVVAEPARRNKIVKE